MHDTTLHQPHDHQLRADENTPSEVTAAVCHVHRAARSDAEEVLLLRLLDLAPQGPRNGPVAKRYTPGPRYDERTGRRGIPASSPDCGSIRGAQVHHRADEPLCDVCQAWSDKRHQLTRTEPGSRCGTPSGAQMHRQLGEKVCDPCRAAESEKSSKRHAATYVPSERPWGRPRKHQLADRAATPRERTVLLLTQLHGVVAKDGHYLTVAADDVTACVVGCSKAGWLDLTAPGAPVLTDAGRAEIARNQAKPEGIAS